MLGVTGARCKHRDENGVLRADYFIDEDPGPMPVRWLSPEIVQQHHFSEKSDVWAYVTLPQQS